MCWLFSNKSTQSPTVFSPNPYDCRRFGDSAAPKTRIRLGGDFGGPMPTGLKGHQQLWSGCEAKPSERQSRPFGSGYAAGYIELSRKRHHATWRVERSAISMGHYVPLLEFNRPQIKSAIQPTLDSIKTGVGNLNSATTEAEKAVRALARHRADWSQKTIFFALGLIVGIAFVWFSYVRRIEA